MKKFWKKHHKWIIPVGVLVILAVVWFLLYLNGCRFVHNPSLSITWEQSAVIADWVGAIAAIVGVIVSGIAIFYAIRVPKEIANGQERIELFQRRLDLYGVLKNCKTFATQVSNHMQQSEVCAAFVLFFGNQRTLSGDKKIIDECAYTELMKAQNILESGKYIFNFETKNVIDPLISTLEMLIMVNTTEQNYKNVRNDYLNAVSKVDDAFLAKIENELILKSVDK